MEEQLDQEVRFHLDQYAADLVARGEDPGEARRQARLALGGPELVKEECRDARGTRWLEDLWQDLRYAIRMLRQKPGFAAVALGTLALGVGATTVMFTMINSVILKPLPYPEPGRLVQLQEQTDYSTHWGNLWSFTYPNFLDCRREVHSLDVGGFQYGGGIVSKPGDAEFVDGLQVSSGLLSVWAVPMLRGRAFLPEEDRPGGPPVAIISQRMWQRRFAESPDAIGAPLTFEGTSYMVVGIVPESLRLTVDADVFTLLGQNTQPFMQNRERHGIRVRGRLQPGATLAQARAELATIAHRLAEQYPKSNKGRTFIADPLRPDVQSVESSLWLLLGAVSLVLLIACANIASLLLARAISRQREMAMRLALGASRGRLARQCLAESAVLGLSGGAFGVALAAAGFRPFVVFWPGGLPRAGEVRLDWHVLLFAVGVSLASSLLFGLAPALRVAAREFEQTLRAGARTVGGGSRRIHGAFVTSEIALAVVLLVSAGMLGSTLVRLSSLDPGVNVHNVLTARTALSPAVLANPARTRVSWMDLLDRVRRVPGVEAVTMIDTVPMREGNNQIGYRTTPADVPDNQQPLVLAASVTPDYLNVMGIPLHKGRFFDDHDRLGSQGVVVIDDVMAQQAFSGQEPVGKHVWIGLGSDPMQVVGVVGHVRQWGLAGDDRAEVRAQLYYPFQQVPDGLVRRWSELMSIAVRTRLDPMNTVEPLRREVRGPSGDQVIYELNTLEHLAQATLAQQRFLMLLFGIFAGLALLLACVGIYGVMAYLTGQRVPEIGVRMALGASAGDVLRMVLGQSLGMIVAGVAIGAAAAFAAARVLERLVEGMLPAEAGTFAAVVALLVLSALLASFVPARRASRVAPMSALRLE